MAKRHICGKKKKASLFLSVFTTQHDVQEKVTSQCIFWMNEFIDACHHLV